MKKLGKDIKALMIVSIVLLLGVLLVYFGSSIATPDSSVLRDQEVDNLLFKNTNLVYENNISTYTVDVTNNNTETYSLKYVNIKISLPEEKEYNLIGYIGESLDSNETRKLTASIDQDLTSATNIEYSIVK